ncbi:MAG: HD domain-containing protein [Spirochaetales bacterium]|nr:HD domain-containing protein [Spirochaetales bacterium]
MNIAESLELFFNKITLPQTVKDFAEIFKKNGFQLYLVGGAVRDCLMGKDVHDYDFATNAKPEDVQKIFRHTIPVGLEHGTVLVLFQNEEFEVTTFRNADNTFANNINEDLKCRDFTINAFAYDISNGKVIDLFDGKKDLKNKMICAVDNPTARIQEDPLRMLRACRFAAVLEFCIEPKTIDAIKENVQLIQNVSAERIRDELCKLMTAAKPSCGLELKRTTGLLDIILPELMEGFGFEQNRFHKYDVYYHNVYSCDNAPASNLEVRIAALLHDVAKPRTSHEKANDDGNSFYNHEIIGSRMAGRILKRLKFSTAQISHIKHLIKHHMFYYTKEWTDGAVRRFIRNVGAENLEDLFLLRDADRNGNGSKTGIPKAFIDFQDKIREIMEIDSALKVTDLDINGRDLIENFQMKQGPIIGEVLNYLLELVLDEPELNKHELLMEKAKEYYEKKCNYALEQYGKPPEELGKF